MCYPSDTEIGLLADGELCCVVPPRIAWGDNPPWPFDEDPAHVYRAALTQFGSVLMHRSLASQPGLLAKVSAKKLPVSKRFTALHPTWEAQFMALLGSGLVAIYLEDHVSPQEARRSC